MQIKLRDLLKTINRMDIPSPDREHQVYQIPITPESPRFFDAGASICNEVQSVVTLTSRRFQSGRKVWFEWMIEVGL